MDQQVLLSILLQQHGDQTYEWIQNVWRGVQIEQEGFNWLGLAEGAAFNARVGNKLSNALPDLIWAKIAVVVYEYLIKMNDENKRFTLEISIMYLKSYCIVKIGSIPNDFILDVNQIIQWFFQNIEMPLDEAEEKLLNWQERTLEDITQLRNIKNRLSVIRYLHQNYNLDINQDLSNWLEIWNKLP